MPVFKDDNYSYDMFVSDGAHAAWLRSSGKIGVGKFESVELFASPATELPGSLAPKQLATGLGNDLGELAVGDGWVAVRLSSGKDVRLYPVNGGVPRHLPSVPDLGWAGGQYDGMAIAGGVVWVLARLYPGSNQVRYLVRFEIAELPAL